MKKAIFIAIFALIAAGMPQVSSADLASGELSGRQAATEVNALIQRMQVLEQQNAQLQLKVQVLEMRQGGTPMAATDPNLAGRVSALENRLTVVEARLQKVAEDLFWFAGVVRRILRF